MSCPPLPRRVWLLAAGAWLVAPGLQAAPPASNFSLEWRLVPWPPAPMPVAPPGTVIVGTTGSTGAPPGTQTTRTAPAPEPPPQRLVLRNGGQAQLTLSRDDLGAGPDWVWTAQGGQGLQGAVRRHGRRESLWVKVDWPGGRAAATLAYRLSSRCRHWPRRRGTAARRRTARAFDQWSVLGHAAPDGTGQALEIRLSPTRLTPPPAVRAQRHAPQVACADPVCRSAARAPMGAGGVGHHLAEGPGAQRLLHAPGLRFGLVAPARAVGPHRADDRPPVSWAITSRCSGLVDSGSVASSHTGVP
jgi:hypothetical protein